MEGTGEDEVLLEGCWCSSISEGGRRGEEDIVMVCLVYRFDCSSCFHKISRCLHSDSGRTSGTSSLWVRKSTYRVSAAKAAEITFPP
jgi:hypothetical protein